MDNDYRIIDTTLREGEQTPGVLFTLAQKRTILDGLAAIGVAEIEIGIASPLISDLDSLIRHSRNSHPTQRLSLWSRCRRDDIAVARRLKPDILSLSMPVSDLHLVQRLGKDRTWARRQMGMAIDLALDYDLRVSVGFEDASRAEPEFLQEMATLAEQSGAERLRLADTVGICSPARMSRMVENVRMTVTNCQLAVHTHNDFGMATANAVAALEAGATWADGTILGLGERAGCARLEELVGYLAIAGETGGLAPARLRGLAEYVAAITANPIEPARPIIGRRIFTCETGLHLQGLQQNPSTYEPYAPEHVGAERKLIYGAKCGRRALAGRLSSLGHIPNRQAIDRHIAAFRERAQFSGSTPTDLELIAATR